MSRALRYFLVLCLFSSTLCEDINHYFLPAAKSVPRIGRSPGKSSNSDFEKFFLKASKSVPRIGRENNVPLTVSRDFWDNFSKYPEQADIANLYEYHPDLFALNELYTIFDENMAGNDVALGRFKRNIPTKFTLNYQ